ncbi:MAG: hypothetical protein KF799_11935 [Bdellovibrionales bacterium]|nr:hypothetical protein [Bdellovibrionales bacterium]
MIRYLIPFLLAAQAQAGELISTGVGLVRSQVVTSREVQMQNLLEVALYEKAAKDKLRILALDSKAFAKGVQDALLEAVVSLEAQNFNLMQISADEIKFAEKQALKVLKDNRQWKELQIAPRELESALRRKLQAKKFIQFRAESSILPVTDAEALRYFEENRLKFGDLPFENFKENIKSYLSKNQVEKRLKDWFDVLLSKYQVKNLISEM